ncbi:50S ribosomal protein L9 [Rhodobacteraceae bacterium NNCM2]|nr:50S ribosomal protein L9 [Coraliihabitans acroporae]
MEIVLLERIEKLGQMGDVVSVRDGYARNFLLPQGKALRANKANLARFEAERAQLEAQNLERRTEAEQVGTKLDGEQFVVIRSASEAGALYGSVTTRDVADVVTEGGFTISKGQVRLDKPVKELGLHVMKVVLHPEVIVEVTINVARSAEEAEIQATGKSIQEMRADEDAESEFDLAELFDDMGGAALDDDDADAPAPAEDQEDGEEPRT